jgi:tRNA dimethylallyltransferase
MLNPLTDRMITILGPTASGKTALAAALAAETGGEVISADSRQVYRGMDIGTGKDYADYTVNGKQVRHHLIDIAEPSTEYNIFRYQQDFLQAYRDLLSRDKTPILCGGSGMYLEAVLRGYRLTEAPPDPELTRDLETLANEELEAMLRALRKLHNKTDLETRERMIRAIAIERKALQETSGGVPSREPFPAIPSVVFGISFPRGLLKKRITDRLQTRLDGGMIPEIEALLARGITPERLMRYGLEYKFGTMYLTGMISREMLFTELEKSIHQFAKRQMTWFRRMERQGIAIRWIDGRIPLGQKLSLVRDGMCE